jgi:hypothetical protein
MTVFDRLFQRAGFPALLAQFGEDITYVPLRGEPRTVKAIVDRNPPTAFDAVDNIALEEVQISVYNDGHRGILSSTVNTGGDRVEVARRKGRKAQSLAITTLDDDSGGVCVLRLR